MTDVGWPILPSRGCPTSRAFRDVAVGKWADTWDQPCGAWAWSALPCCHPEAAQTFAKRRPANEGSLYRVYCENASAGPQLPVFEMWVAGSGKTLETKSCDA